MTQIHMLEHAIDAYIQPLFNYGIDDAGIEEYDIDEETVFSDID